MVGGRVNIATVMDALGAAVDTIAGVRVFPYWADRVVPPAAVVSFPSPLTFDVGYQRGGDRAEFPLTLLVGKVDARSARDDLAKYLNGTGADSVKTAIEAHVTTAWDSVRVTQAEVAVISIAGTEYLGAEFTIDVIGGA